MSARGFITDDAFISFRYARSVAEGHGPVFNPGERVEGYTNPLWVYLLASAAMIGAPPEVVAPALGLLAGVGTIVAAYGFARRVSPPLWAALIPAALCLSHDLGAWSISGLETSLFVFLITASAWRGAVEREGDHRPLSVWIAGLAALTRPEGLLWVAGVLKGRSFRATGVRVGIALVMLIPLQSFRAGYYGDWLPNTFHAKGAINLGRGLFYLGEFLRTHPGIPLWAPLAALAGRDWRVATPLTVYLAYLVAVGGDFMEFRMMVPVIVLSLALMAGLLPRLRRGMAVVLALGSVAGTWLPTMVGYRQASSPYMIESIDELAASASGWSRVGEFLGAMADPDDLIAVGPAGAIPFFSRLPAVDMLGLTDRWVARHGVPSSAAAGHERVAPYEYLARRRVVWLVGQPEVRRDASAAWEKISVRMPDGTYLILGTTLNPDSLRAVLAGRGVVVGAAGREGEEVQGRHAADQVVEGWRLANEGRRGEAHDVALNALEIARGLGTSWRWLVREAGLLADETGREPVGEERERKRWKSIPGEIPPAWRSALYDAKGAGDSLDTTGAAP
ncbi:MAG: hypothetical protein MUE60_00535 [Candidatus Eisenbacteria bacterium]|nr:hypothetical protein [Candidatus Eisenbacteria bacterium]